MFSNGKKCAVLEHLIAAQKVKLSSVMRSSQHYSSYSVNIIHQLENNRDSLLNTSPPQNVHLINVIFSVTQTGLRLAGFLAVFSNSRC